MGNISYFCIVKRFISLLRCLSLIICLLPANNISAQHYVESDLNMDSVEISLLTCRPRQNVYSLYGHTAIRIQDKQNHLDMAVNYGMFSFDKPFFILRFVFGLTDYSMDIEDFEAFRIYYATRGAGVKQQTLNLTKEEKRAIIDAIIKNYEPQNRVYRYNYFYDNCTTRARDILLDNINGTIRYQTRNKNSESYREMIHDYNEQQRWARFGNDLLLGIKADFPTNHEQQQFLPDNLRKDFDNAVVIDKNGQKRALVSNSSWVVLPGTQAEWSGFPLSPTTCAIIFFVIVVAFSIYERCKIKMFWGMDIFLMLLTGLCGLILLAMVFSQHPTVRVNLQILLLNPISLIFLYPTVKCLRRNIIHRWLMAWMILIVLFLIGGFFQSYAEGMTIVALSLLIRYILKFDQIVRTRK